MFPINRLSKRSSNFYNQIMEEIVTEQKKEKIRIFKYNALLSLLFFLVSTLYLSSKTQNYSFTKHTISGMSRFLDSKNLSFFNMLFFIKASLDLSFTYYIFRHFRLKIRNLISLVWLISILSFGLLGFFPTVKYQIIHLFIVCIMFVGWTLSEYFFAEMIGEDRFQYFTNNIILLQVSTIFLFIGTNNINAIFEIIYMMLVFIWISVFISRHLQ